MKTRSYIAVGLSGLALLVSVISLWISAYRPAELGVDYLGITIGALSLLVTLLIGWNIYTAIDVKKNVSVLENKVSKMYSDFHSKITNTGEVLAKGIIANESQTILGLVMLYANNPDLDRYNHGLIIEYGLYLIDNHIKSGRIDRANEIVRIINDCLRGGGSVIKGRKEILSDIALSINGFNKLTDGNRLMTNVLNLKTL